MNACAVWDFRCNKGDYTVDTLKEWLKENCKKWCFQLERGDTGYEHWQGRFSLFKKRTKILLMKLFTIVPNYLEPTSNQNRDNEFYVLKADTRIDGPYSDKSLSALLPRQYRDISLYPYQEKILKSAEVFDSRTVNLVYDPEGGKGKSTIAAILEIKYNGIDVPPLNDYKELVALIYDICSSRRDQPKIMCFDMPRACKKDQLYGLYSAIEQVKKGKVYDCRHSYRCMWIDSPQIWVFTNRMPDLSMLSVDRWKLWELNDMHDLVPITLSEGY